MARRRGKISNGPRVRRLRNFEDSRFWQRLTALETDPDFHGDKGEVAKLRANVGEVVKNSKFILDQISRFLPQYTLHNETHILNVLGLMDALTPDAVMDRLSPLECALCILAAYTHDLGMAFRDEEYRAITDESTESPERQRFLRFRDRYGEEVRQIDRLRRTGDAGDRLRADHIEAHVLADYIRTTHTDGDAARSRVNGWLEAIKAPGVANNLSLFQYQDTDFQQWLVLIGASHGRDAEWLRKQLTAPPSEADDFLVLVGGEWVNLAFPGLLLRLADIMDFDASRTPRILFKHLGIDDNVSLQEWNKHLSITGWSLETPEGGEPRLTYSANKCAHPVFEKSIRDFGSWIDAEIRSVREELHWQRHLVPGRGERYGIYLRHAVDLKIKPAGWPQAPIYTYHDLQFRLDQDEIQQLLMGESLYGDPGLCIRELLQNALDALELRELRLKIVDKGGQPHEPVDPLRIVDGKPDELRVTVTWGRDEASGQDFLRVTDNGVGMTERVIKDFFTQIGKSYYRSPEFHQERAGLRAAGLISSPISIFGIGILSCFMIADRLQVRTRPGHANDADRAPRDITISGPGSLFWLGRGTLVHQGTEVTLFLKPRFRIEHDPKAFEPGLRKHFGYPKGEEYKPGDGVIDPPFISACHVVWPRHPIDLDIPCGMAVRIDERFHIDRLAPINREAVVAKAVEWDCPASFIGEPEWGVWEWDDAQVTGSRSRLWFPRNHTSPNCPDLPVNPPEERGLCRQHELASFIETQLGESGRTKILVRSMFVPGEELALERIGIAPSVGTRVWIDLRGDAAPRLTADRRTMLATEEGGAWRAAIDGTLERAGRALDHGMARATPGVGDNVAYGYLRSNEQAHSIGRGFVTTDFKLKTYKSFDKTLDSTNAIYLTVCIFFQSIFRDKLLSSLARDLGLLRNLRFDLFLDIPNDYERDLRRARMLSRAVVYQRVLANDPGLILALDPDFPKDHARSLARRRAPAADLDRDLEPASIPPVFVSMLVEHVYSSLLQEGFRPDLSSSWPLFGCRSLKGQIGAATLTGPGIVVFDVEEDGRTVHFSDPSGSEPSSLVARGYDLTFPMPAIPLGDLRRSCAAWRTDRRYQPLGVAPFLFPELHGIWRKHAEYLRGTFQVPRIFALLPRLDLWSKPFADWTEEDWSTCGLSALWDLDTGIVLWAHGAHDVDEMPAKGLPAPEFFDGLGHKPQ